MGQAQKAWWPYNVNIYKNLIPRNTSYDFLARDTWSCEFEEGETHKKCVYTCTHVFFLQVDFIILLVILRYTYQTE